VCCTLGPHGPYRVSQNYNRYACEPFCSCKCRFSWISPGSALALHYATENLSDGQLLIHCWNNRPAFSYREKERRGLCSKFRTVDTDVDPCRGKIKKKGMHFRLHVVRRGGEISKKMQPWHSEANYDLKKYSYVTCRGEQSPAKFDTYLCQVKSMFGCEADLNTVTARQLKLTFGTKRSITIGIATG